ncbi:MAG TPA: EAL domain-containing protein [Blastocatellia bacterium]|nr:EAL domain-containing protein [Blastocatellia bacterium]
MSVEVNSKQRLAQPYMRVVIAIGMAALAWSLWRLKASTLDWRFLVLASITVATGSRFNINIPRFKSNVSISDVFIFLAMLLFDGEAAIVLGAIESYCSSFRITKKRLTRLFNAAAMACSMSLTVLMLRVAFGNIVEIASGDFLKLVMATCAMAVVQYFINSCSIAIAAALRANQPVWDTWKTYYLWTAISYFSAALAAGVIVRLSSIYGLYTFVAAAPILAIVYFTYQTYLKNIEASMAQAELAERHLAELQESEERFRSAFDHAPIGIAIVSPEGRWLSVNRSLCEIVGYSEEELLATNTQAITHESDFGQFMSKVNEVLDGRTLTEQMEKRYIHKAGYEVWVMASISLIREPRSKASNLIFQVQHISDRKRAEEQLRHEALHDMLTGLPNRANFMQKLRGALDRVKAGGDAAFAVLFLDLDRFKVINDSLGHMAGDQLLIGIARRLRNCLRPGDVVARLGGDEFTILLNNIKDKSDAEHVADRVQRMISQPFTLGGYETSTTVSIGIAFPSPEYQQAEDLLRDADTAMYQAKSLGKAQFVIFDKKMHTHAMSIMQIESDLRRSIDRHEFLIHYQPIISLQNGVLAGFEALIRWRHPERGLISPSDFIPVAEETGLIVPIGEWVLKESCRQMRRWQKSFNSSPLFISVNLSSKQFAHSTLLEQIVETLDATGLDPCSLKLEITESVVMQNIEVATGMLEHLRSIGVQLSIDDFGTGYSSLSYLYRLPIDTLKIDRSFISHLSGNNENREIVRTIITLAKTLGMGVVAEGIETQDQLDLLKNLKCDYGQGYLYSKPLEANAAEQLIAAMQSQVAISTEISGEVFLGPLKTEYRM